MSSLLLTVLSVSSCVSFCRSVFCQCAIHRHRARLPFYRGKRRVKDLSAMLKSGHVSALFVSAVIKSKLWQDKKKKKSTPREAPERNRVCFVQQQVKPCAKKRWKVLDPFMFCTFISSFISSSRGGQCVRVSVCVCCGQTTAFASWKLKLFIFCSPGNFLHRHGQVAARHKLLNI